MTTEVILTNSNTLFEELELFNKKMEDDSAGTKVIKKELYGNVQIDQIPFEIQEEFIRSKLNIPPHIWNGYEPELKGKTIAAEIVKGQMETLERFEGILERNRNKKK